jgi:hypothetical protein
MKNQLAYVLPALSQGSTYQFIFGLGNDEIGYLIPQVEWDEEPPWLRTPPHPGMAK